MPADGPSVFDEGPFDPCPVRFNMAEHTLRAADVRPDKIALEVLAAPGRVVIRRTFGALAEMVRATAGALTARGIGRGDRVALRLGNVEDFPILFSRQTRSARYRCRSPRN